MINNILNKRVNKTIFYIMLANILFIILYKVVEVLKNNLIFRGWVNILFQVSIVMLIILGIMFVNICLCSSYENDGITKWVKNVFTAFKSIAVIGSLGIGFSIFCFTYKPESTLTIQGKKVIAQVNEGWHYSNVYYYEPVNIFFMKPSDIESEQYDGGYDIFAIRESD